MLEKPRQDYSHNIGYQPKRPRRNFQAVDAQIWLWVDKRRVLQRRQTGAITRGRLPAFTSPNARAFTRQIHQRTIKVHQSHERAALNLPCRSSDIIFSGFWRAASFRGASATLRLRGAVFVHNTRSIQRLQRLQAGPRT